MLQLEYMKDSLKFWGRTGFDAVLSIVSACRALTECSLNN